MALTAFDKNTAGSAGTPALTVGAESFLGNVNVAGTFQLVVDKFNMAAGDVLELRVYQMVLTAGTARIVYFGRWDGVQPTEDMIANSIVVSNELTDSQALRFSINQTRGTQRNFAWKILQWS